LCCCSLHAVACWRQLCSTTCVLWPVGVTYAVQPVCCGLLVAVVQYSLCAACYGSACVLRPVGGRCYGSACVLRPVRPGTVQHVCCGRWVAKPGYSRCAWYSQSVKYSMQSLPHELPSWLSIACMLWPIKWPVERYSNDGCCHFDGQLVKFNHCTGVVRRFRVMY